MKFFYLFFLTTLPVFAQIGGSSVFQFLSLNTSPRASSLGGYAYSIVDSDLSIGIYNPAVINSSMVNKLLFNYTNYYDGILYGDVGYCFNLLNRAFTTSLKFINYGDFIETDLYGNELGVFTAGEYALSLGSSHTIDSTLFIGFNAKIAYSSFYEVSSVALLTDFSATYIYPEKDIIISLIMKNFGYQIVPYYQGNVESLPFELLIGLSNKLAHMPLRWHLTFQHIERPKLTYDNNLIDLNQELSLGENILRHVVLGAELLISNNVNILLGYNNRLRSEMMIYDRRGLVGFSCGIMLKIHRFHLNYSRSSSHFSGPVNTFGILTNLRKFD